MLPASMLPVFTIFGVAVKVDGAMPKLQVIMPPVQVWIAIALSPVRRRRSRRRAR